MSVGEEIILRLSSGPRNRLVSIGFDCRIDAQDIDSMPVEFCVHRMNATIPPDSPSSPEASSPGHLELLRLLEQHPDYSQRELAVALGISLGKTHYLLKALLMKGWVKAKNFQRSGNKLGYLYVLTPIGVNSRLQLTRTFLVRKEAEYEALRTQIMSLRDELAAQADAANTPAHESDSVHSPSSNSTGANP
jgi:EPS-associated MarR family transcriptional regulator